MGGLVLVWSVSFAQPADAFANAGRGDRISTAINSDVAGVLGLDRSTAHRKAARDELLPAHATESILRLLELDELASTTFTTAQGAADWLRKPHPLLDGQATVACAASSYGARRVREILVATRYGGVV